MNDEMDEYDLFNSMTKAQCIQWGDRRKLDIFEDATHTTLRDEWAFVVLSDMRDLITAEQAARALTTQRDELLAALEGLVNAPIDDSAELVIAQAAIEAAKGEA